MAKKPASPKQVVLSGRVFDEVIMTEQECRSFTDEWKDKLGLRDWVVSLRMARERDMPLEGTQACVRGDLNKRFIFLYVLHPEDYGDSIVPQNMKKSILHELMHVVLYPLNIKKKLDVEEERIVEDVATALYNAAKC